MSHHGSLYQSKRKVHSTSFFLLSHTITFLLCHPQGFPGRDGVEVSLLQIHFRLLFITSYYRFAVIIFLSLDNYCNYIYMSASGATRNAWEDGTLKIFLTFSQLNCIFMWAKVCNFDIYWFCWQGEDGGPGYPGSQGPQGAKVEKSITHQLFYLARWVFLMDLSSHVLAFNVVCETGRGRYRRKRRKRHGWTSRI